MNGLRRWLLRERSLVTETLVPVFYTLIANAVANAVLRPHIQTDVMCFDQSSLQNDVAMSGSREQAFYHLKTANRSHYSA